MILQNKMDKPALDEAIPIFCVFGANNHSCFTGLLAHKERSVGCNMQPQHLINPSNCIWFIWSDSSLNVGSFLDGDCALDQWRERHSNFLSYESIKSVS